MGFNADHVEEVLLRGITEIVYIKNDGSISKMYCTKNDNIVSRFVQSKDKIKDDGTDRLMKNDKENGIFRIFDLDKRRFGVFKRSALISFKEFRGNIGKFIT